MFLPLFLPIGVYEGTWPKNTPSHIVTCAQTHSVHMHQVQYAYTYMPKSGSSYKALVKASHMNQTRLYLHTKVHTQNYTYTCLQKADVMWVLTENTVFISLCHKQLFQISRWLTQHTYCCICFPLALKLPFQHCSVWDKPGFNAACLFWWVR